MTPSVRENRERRPHARLAARRALIVLACAVVLMSAAVAVAAVTLKPDASSAGAGCAVVVRATPTGPPAPPGGWHVAFADGFAAPLAQGAAFTRGARCASRFRHARRSRDRLWQLPRANERAEQSNDLNVYSASQVRIGLNGLELVAHHASNIGGTGKDFVSGAVHTMGKFTLRSYAGATFAIECVCRWPRNGGAADPAFWHDGNEHDTEQEVDDFEGWGWGPGVTSWASTNAAAGMPVIVKPYHDHTVQPVTSGLGFDPSAGFHRYTTVMAPGAHGRTRADEYVDGRYRWTVEVATPTTSVRQSILLSYALRQYPSHVLPGDTTFAARAVAVYEDGAHAGQFVTGGGVATGTVVR
jgi:hypothetical protein